MNTENETQAQINHKEMTSQIQTFLQAISSADSILGLSAVGKTRVIQSIFGRISPHVFENEPVVPYLLVKLPVPSILDDVTPRTNTTFTLEVIDEAQWYKGES
jgi:hypothetical protein